MKINNISVVPRKNRPTVLGKTALEFYYIKNGVYSDPYQVCSVVLVRDQVASSTNLSAISNGDPEAYLDYEASSSRYGLLSSGIVGAVDCRWENYSDVDNDNSLDEHIVDPSGIEFDPTNYGGDVNSASGIFRLGEGHFSVVLQPNGLYLSALHDIATGSDYSTTSLQVQSASTVATYFDIWTIVDNAGALPKTYINKVYLYNDTIMGLAEPLSVTAKNSLVQKYVNVNSRVNLRIRTDIALNDNDTPTDIRNIFNDSVLQNAQLKIRKYNENEGAWETTVDWSDVDTITSSDTMLFSYTFGDIGRYEIQTKYIIMDETIYSDKFKLICR